MMSSMAARAAAVALMFLLSLMGAANVGARTFEIPPGQNQLRATLPQLAAGDSILLATSGAYVEHGELLLPEFPLTILAPTDLDSRPVLQMEGLLVWSDLRVRSVALDGGQTAEYAIRSVAGEPSSLIVENCEIRKISKEAVSTAAVPLAWCEIRDLDFHDIGGHALGFADKDMVRALQVSNSTFHRLGAAAIAVAQAEAPVSVRISNVTIHDAGDGIVLDNVAQAVLWKAGLMHQNRR